MPLPFQKPNFARDYLLKPETLRQQRPLAAKDRAPSGELTLVPFRTSPVSIPESSAVCYSSPGLRYARILQQAKAAIYELDHTRIDNAVEDIVPIAPRLDDSAIRKALELVANGLRLHTKLRCQAAWINLTLLQQHMQKTKARIIR
jgi:hypothetical protein